jgi:hypothetical protein
MRRSSEPPMRGFEIGLDDRRKSVSMGSSSVIRSPSGAFVPENGFNPSRLHWPAGFSIPIGRKCVLAARFPPQRVPSQPGIDPDG